MAPSASTHGYNNPQPQLHSQIKGLLAPPPSRGHGGQQHGEETSDTSGAESDQHQQQHATDSSAASRSPVERARTLSQSSVRRCIVLRVLFDCFRFCWRNEPSARGRSFLTLLYMQEEPSLTGQSILRFIGCVLRYVFGHRGSWALRDGAYDAE